MAIRSLIQVSYRALVLVQPILWFSLGYSLDQFSKFLQPYSDIWFNQAAHCDRRFIALAGDSIKNGVTSMDDLKSLRGRLTEYGRYCGGLTSVSVDLQLFPVEYEIYKKNRSESSEGQLCYGFYLYLNSVGTRKWKEFAELKPNLFDVCAIKN